MSRNSSNLYRRLFFSDYISNLTWRDGPKNVPKTRWIPLCLSYTQLTAFILNKSRLVYIFSNRHDFPTLLRLYTKIRVLKVSWYTNLMCTQSKGFFLIKSPQDRKMRGKNAPRSLQLFERPFWKEPKIKEPKIISWADQIKVN